MNSTMAILCLIGAILGCALFFNYLTGVGKSFKSQPNTSSVQAAKIKSQQHESAEEAQRKQQEMMDQIRQKMQDNSRR